ncbi:MAG: hypothetical protein LBP96_06025 [Bacteroidales bacterium]|jgi:antitoxin component YwqK of YwqJK toxin-antitoxin module|nr:hypothetical protein [Bacteroidales bacterium]
MLLNLSKYAAFCCLITLSSALFAQAQTISPSPDTNFIDSKGLRQGIWKVIRPEGMSYIGQFKDGNPYGQFRHFDRYDRTISILDYFRDGYAAKVTHFHPSNGKIRATGFFLERERDSTWEMFDTEGRLMKRENYKDGMLHGLAETFDREGNCIDSTEWYRDLRNGYWWRKDEDGTQWTTYKLNLSHGVYEAYYENENPRIKGVYEEGLKEKTWYLYHGDGLLDRVMQYKNNRLIRKQVAVTVGGKDILLDSDSVAYMHTNGRIAEVKMLDGTTHRPVQSFDNLVKSFDVDDFFLANPRFFVQYRMFDSFVLDAEDEKKLNAEPLLDEDDETERRKSIKGLMKLKIPAPYDIVVDGETILLFRNTVSAQPVPKQ